MAGYVLPSGLWLLYIKYIDVEYDELVVLQYDQLLVTVLAPSQHSRFACELTCRARYKFICIVLY